MHQVHDPQTIVRKVELGQIRWSDDFNMHIQWIITKQLSFNKPSKTKAEPTHDRDLKHA